MLLFNLLPVAILASTVLADGASIIAAVDKIVNATLTLNSTVAAWNGNLLGTIPIIAASTTLLIDINDGTSVATASANLTILEAVEVALATITLVEDVEAALTTVIEARKKFIDLLLAPVILIDLELEKSASDKFAAAVIAKVPAALAPLADTIVAPIDVIFDYAIGNYTGVL